MPGNHGTTLKLNSVSRQYNNKIVKCEVNNVIGKSEETETLDVHCNFFYIIFLRNDIFFALDDPKFIIQPSDVSGERGQDINLTCLVDGNPPPSYTWFRNGDMRHVSLKFLLFNFSSLIYFQHFFGSDKY